MVFLYGVHTLYKTLRTLKGDDILIYTDIDTFFLNSIILS
jgi:hypothetical protein